MVSSTDFLTQLSNRTQDQQASNITINNGLGPLLLISNIEKALHLDLMEAFLQLSLPSSLMILAWIK